MTSFVVRQALGLVGLFLALASCGPVPQAGGGIGGTGSVATVSSGPVTKFGSVYVSGTKYDNLHTIYCLDDDPCSSENKLKLGMIVLVNGRTTEHYANNQSLARIADKITFEETVEGVVQSRAADGLSLVVLGQVVHINHTTVIDSSIPGQSITNLIPDVDHIEVSGFVVGDGHILATLIMMQRGTPHYEIQGTIKSHNAAAHTFEIGALEIHYDHADTSQMPTNQTWDQLVVHIRGDQWSQGGSSPYGARLIATRVKPFGVGIEDGTEAEVEGFILRANAPGDFFVNNLHVQTTVSTVFEGGGVNDLVTGVHLEIHGNLAGGALQAEHISFKNEVELASSVTSLDPASKSFTLSGLPGLTVHVNSTTAIGGIQNLSRFEDIRTGDYLTIHGRLAARADITATEMERTDLKPVITLQSPVTAFAEPTLILAGVTIDTSAIPENGFLDGSGIIGRNRFFSGLRLGHHVRARGALSGTSVAWQTMRSDSQ